MNKTLKGNLQKINGLRFWQALSVIEQQVLLLINILCAKLLSNLITISTNGEVNNALKVAGLIGLAVGCKAIISFVFSLKYNIFSASARHSIELNAYSLIENVSIARAERKKGGAFFESINDDLNTVAEYATKTVPESLGAIICALGYLSFLLIGNPIIAIIMLAISLVQIVPPVIVKEFMAKNYDDTREIESELSDEIISGYRGFEAIRLYAAEKWELGRIAEIHRRYVKVGNKSSLSLQAENAMLELCGFVLKIGTYITVGVLYLRNNCTLEAAVSAIAISSSFYTAIRKIFIHIPKIRVANLAIERNNWLLDFEESNTANNGAVKRAIVINDVSFHEGDKNIIQHLSTEIDLDSKSLITGKNGSGKTTMLELILGIRTPSTGAVEYEGCSRSSFRYCQQEDLSLNMTIEKLFSLTDEETHRIVTNNANLLGLTVDDYKKRIRDLSGGEKKKVFLSLALAYRDCPVILDEPTNHIDVESVDKLIILLEKHNGGLIIASHDNRMKKVAIRTLELKDGVIAYEKIDNCI